MHKATLTALTAGLLMAVGGCSDAAGGVDLEVMKRDQQPADVLPPELSEMVRGMRLVEGSSRRVGEVNGVGVWAARGQDDRVCLIVDDEQGGGCTTTSDFNRSGVTLEGRAGNESVAIRLVPDGFDIETDEWQPVGENLRVRE